MPLLLMLMLLLMGCITSPTATRDDDNALDVDIPGPLVLATTPLTSKGTRGFDCAVLLFAATIFVMSLFYLLNHSDKDIRGYSWQVVSSSIAFFTGVQIGGALNGGVMSAMSKLPVGMQIFVQVLVMLGWYVVLQTVLARIAGAVGERPESRVRSVLENMECGGMLLGITTGASNLLLWGFVQRKIGEKNVWLAALTIPLSWVCLWALFSVGDMYRERLTTFDDGQVDVYERIYEKYAERTENGSACFCIAHIVVQAIRFMITGDFALFPQPSHTPVTVLQSGLLFAISLLFAGLFLWLGSIPNRLGRFQLWAKNISGNTFAFCLMQAVYHLIYALVDPAINNRVAASLVLAMIGTLLGIAIILMLDWFADLEITGEEIDAPAIAFVAPLSMFIGLTWREAFGQASVVLKQAAGKNVKAWFGYMGFADVQADVGPFVGVVMALTISAVVVPAWKWHILTRVPSLEATVAKFEQMEQKEKTAAVSAGVPNTSRQSLGEAQTQSDIK